MNGGRGVEWGGRMPPSGVVTGFRRDFACNVLETKSRIAPRNVVPTLNAKSRLRPLGGLKPALRPPSGVNAGPAKRGPFPSPVYGGRCPKGGREDEVARRRKRWICQAASLLGFTAASLAFETLQAMSLHFSFCHSAAVLFQKLPSGVNAGLAKREFSLPPFTGEGARRAEGGDEVAKRRKHRPVK